MHLWKTLPAVPERHFTLGATYEGKGIYSLDMSFVRAFQAAQTCEAPDCTTMLMPAAGGIRRGQAGVLFLGRSIWYEVLDVDYLSYLEVTIQESAMKQNRKHTLITTALGAITELGLATFASQALAVGLADGDYTIYIRETPLSGGVPIFGANPTWNSSFTFGGNAPGLGSNYMPDTGALGQGGRGSGISGDTIPGLTTNNKAVGRIGIRVNNNAISITSFSKDLIPGTAGGDFVQYYSPTVAGPDASAGVTGVIITVGHALYERPSLSVTAMFVVAAICGFLLHRFKKAWIYYYAGAIASLVALVYAWPRLPE